MSLSHQVTYQFTPNNGGAVLRADMTVAVDGETNIDVALPLGATNQAVAFAFDVTKGQTLFLVTDIPVTIKTNSTSSPAQTITLPAGKGQAWAIGGTGAQACPITTTTSVLYVTNNGTSAGTLKIRSGFNLS